MHSYLKKKEVQAHGWAPKLCTVHCNVSDMCPTLTHPAHTVIIRRLPESGMIEKWELQLAWGSQHKNGITHYTLSEHFICHTDPPPSYTHFLFC